MPLRSSWLRLRFTWDFLIFVRREMSVGVRGTPGWVFSWRKSTWQMSDSFLVSRV